MRRKINKKRVSLILVMIVLIACAAGAVLYFTELKPEKKSSSTNSESAAVYYEYLDMYLLLSQNGTVLGAKNEEPEGIPKISGVHFGNLVIGEKAVPADESTYNYVMETVRGLKGYYITDVKEVTISEEKEVSVYIDEIIILLGKQNRTNEKLDDLRKFYDKVIRLKGTLDMQEVNDNNWGYTFKISE